MVFRMPSQAEIMDFAVDTVGIAAGDLVDKYLTSRLEQYVEGFGRLVAGALVGLFGPMLVEKYLPNMPELGRITRLAGAAVAAEWLKSKLPSTGSRVVIPRTAQRVYVPPAKPRSNILW